MESGRKRRLPMFIHKPRLRCHPCRVFPFSLLRFRASVPSYLLLLPTRRLSHSHFFFFVVVVVAVFVVVIVVLIVIVVDNHDDDYDYDGDVQQREQNVATPPTPPPRINLISFSFTLFPCLSFAIPIASLSLFPSFLHPL